MSNDSVIAAYGAVNSPLIPRTPGWHGPDEVPEVQRNDYRYFQIAVRRKNSGKVFSFPAVYCNTYAVTVEYDPSESQGTSWSMHFLGEDLAEEGELGCTGWWDIKSNNEYDCQFSAALEEGDELVGWCELPQWHDPSTSREEEVGQPPAGLLVSMAMRLNHGFGGDDARSQQVQLTDMRRCWEEVTGRGFYKSELEATYLSNVKVQEGSEA